MHLELGQEDLKPEYKDAPCHTITFDRLTEKAQQAVRLAGRAVFYDSGLHHEAIVVPHE